MPIRIDRSCTAPVQHMEVWSGCSSRVRYTTLAPMSFHQNPSSIPMDPAMRYPMSVRAGRHFPSSRHPDISTAIPAVISGDPDIARAGRWDACLNDWMRRPHSNHHFLPNCSDSYDTCEQNPHQCLLQHNLCSFFFATCETQNPSSFILTCHLRPGFSGLDESYSIRVPIGDSEG